MMRAAVDRSRPTQGGFATSVGAHVLLLLFVAFALKSGGKLPDMAEELTKISYIEAHLGEDIEKKVELKTLAKRTPPSIEAGRGVSTRSAQKKPKTPAAVTPPKPRSRPAAAAAIDPAVPKPTEIQQKRLDTASRLDSRDDQLSAQLDAPTQRTRTTEAADTAAPTLASRSGPAPDLATRGGDLENRRSTLDVIGGDIDPSTTGGRAGGSAIADAGEAGVPSGGSLQGRGRASYSTPGSALKPSRGGGAIAEAGGTDIAPPSGGGSEGGGRRTILDYGTGGGGGGGLRSRGGGIAPAPDRAVDPERSAPADQGIAEAAPKKLDQDGMGMTISGQIAGRKILNVVAPEYTAKARRNGWEGVVAVHFTVLPDGRVKDNTRVQQMSAHSDLNRAAMAAIEKFRFAPLAEGKSQVEQWGVITFVFRLK